jgi:hypothetical protein
MVDVVADPDLTDEAEDDPEDDTENEEGTTRRKRESHFSRAVKISVRAHESVSSVPNVIESVHAWAAKHKYVVHVSENESGSTSLTIFTPESYEEYLNRSDPSTRIPRSNRGVFAHPDLQEFIAKQRAEGKSDNEIQELLISKLFS